MIRPSVLPRSHGVGEPTRRPPRLGAWHNGLRQLLRRLPGPCALCAQRCQGELCSACRQHLRAGLWSQACLCCAAPVAQLGIPCAACTVDPPAFETTVTAMAYSPPADTLISQLKVGKRYGRAELLADLLCAAWQQAGLGVATDSWVVPVPAAPLALRQRGFNPAGEIAGALSRQLGLTLRRDVLMWRALEEHQSQRGLGRERRLARRSAFVLRPHIHSLQGRTLVLVDDVMTTGATLDGAARVLVQAGAARVVAAVAARTPPPDWSRSL